MWSARGDRLPPPRPSPGGAARSARLPRGDPEARSAAVEAERVLQRASLRVLAQARKQRRALVGVTHALTVPARTGRAICRLPATTPEPDVEAREARAYPAAPAAESTRARTSTDRSKERRSASTRKGASGARGERSARTCRAPSRAKTNGASPWYLRARTSSGNR